MSERRDHNTGAAEPATSAGRSVRETLLALQACLRQQGEVEAVALEVRRKTGPRTSTLLDAGSGPIVPGLFGEIIARTLGGELGCTTTDTHTYLKHVAALLSERDFHLALLVDAEAALSKLLTEDT
jgi:hypothetical protein